MIFFLIIPFLFIGSIAYLLCAVIPPLRRFAMPSSLWLLSLCIGLYLWISIILVMALGYDRWNAHAQELHLWHIKDFKLPETKAFSIVSIVALVATCLTLASLVTVIHQVIIHRLTLALFRLYVAGVSLGVGITFFLPASVFLATRSSPPSLQTAAMFAALLLGLAAALALAFFCLKRSSQFRGAYPQNFALVTRDEFERA
jgi:hypothetical protein